MGQDSRILVGSHSKTCWLDVGVRCYALRRAKAADAREGISEEGLAGSRREDTRA